MCSIPRTESIDNFPSAIEPEFPETRHLRPRGWCTCIPWTQEDMEYLHISYTRQLTGRSLACKDLPAYDAFKRRWGAGIHLDNLIDISH